MSISAQGVVERASAELSKRINGLGLSGRSNSASSKNAAQNAGSGGPNSVPQGQTVQKHASVMERVTNVLCGGGNAPEKPSRCLLPNSASNVLNKNQRGTPPAPLRHNKGQFIIHNRQDGLKNQHQPRQKPVLPPRPNFQSFDQLLMNEQYLSRLFWYFTPLERRNLARVCQRWRDVLYRGGTRWWIGLRPAVRCRELRQCPPHDRARLYASFPRRGMYQLCLIGCTDEDALDLPRSYPMAGKHVHALSLRCSPLTDRGLEILLENLQALRELELCGCNELTEAGLWACLTPRIVSLTLADCINVADEAVGAVAQLLPSLYEFSLQAYHVTDAALGYFSPKQSASLTILRLQSCWELTNHGIVNIVHSLPNLTVLSLSGCSKVTDDGVELIAENLQRLRSLDLSWCPRITDAALEYIACDLNQLEELTLDRCVHVTDIGVGYISTMLSLSALFLRWCSQVRDFGLQHLCGMRNLQVLSLAGCPLLSSSGLSSLIQLRHLRELELTNCPGASRELFDYLREHLPRCLIIE